MSNSQKVTTLVEKAKSLSDGKPLTKEEIHELEQTLGVRLPSDFIEINSVCSYEFIYFTSSLNFPSGVIEDTLYYREQEGLSDDYIVLSHDDVSFEILHILPCDKSEVIWCDVPDFYNLCEGKPFEYNPTIFPTFTDFYSYLIDEEEKIRAEESGPKSG